MISQSEHRFPRIPHDEKMSTKLTLKNIGDMRVLYETGTQRTVLEEMFGVSRYTVRYWTDNEWQKKERIRNVEKQLRRYQDPFAKKIHTQQDIEYHKRRRKSKTMLSWESGEGKRWKRENPEKYKALTKRGHQVRKKWIKENKLQQGL